MALSNALRQVARNFGREAMERIMGGEAIEHVLTRDQLKELARKNRQSGNECTDDENR